MDYGGTPPAENGCNREIYSVAWSEFIFSLAMPSPSARHTEREIILLKAELTHGYPLAARPSLERSGAFCPLLTEGLTFSVDKLAYY
jgi:hypothetical protein